MAIASIAIGEGSMFQTLGSPAEPHQMQGWRAKASPRPSLRLGGCCPTKHSICGGHSTLVATRHDWLRVWA
jgi:hypothetical protein